jgi:hypothetical protein
MEQAGIDAVLEQTLASSPMVAREYLHRTPSPTEADLVAVEWLDPVARLADVSFRWLSDAAAASAGGWLTRRLFRSLSSGWDRVRFDEGAVEVLHQGSWTLKPGTAKAASVAWDSPCHYFGLLTGFVVEEALGESQPSVGHIDLRRAEARGHPCMPTLGDIDQPDRHIAATLHTDAQGRMHRITLDQSRNDSPIWRTFEIVDWGVPRAEGLEPLDRFK